MKDLSSAVTARHARIVRWLADEGRLDVLDVAGRLGVAQETVRRDLRALENEGLLQRVHGGAVRVEADMFPTGFGPGLPAALGGPSSGASVGTPGMLSPANGSSGSSGVSGSGGPLGAAGPTPLVTGADLALATRLWETLPRSGTLLLGAGRHSLALVAAMSADPPPTEGLTVVSNSLDASIAAARIANLAVYNIGGAVSPRTRAQEGDWALQELERLRVDVSIICPAGISFEHGLGQSTPAAAAVSQAEVRCGQNVIVLADAADVGRPAFVQFATWREIDSLMVSGSPDPAVLRPFLEHGVDVSVTDPAESRTSNEGAP